MRKAEDLSGIRRLSALFFAIKRLTNPNRSLINRKADLYEELKLKISKNPGKSNPEDKDSLMLIVIKDNGGGTYCGFGHNTMPHINGSYNYKKSNEWPYCSYHGDFVYGRREGLGIMNFLFWSKRPGDGYHGEWKDGKMDGKGLYYFVRGDEYEGYWKDNKMNGAGVYYFAKGGKYEGEWIDGVPKGKGILFPKEGGQTEAEFINGKLKK